MPFVNEYISAEDFEKYQLREIDKHHVVGGVNARTWTVDSVRDMYLRKLANGREEFSHQMEWTFYWRGQAHTLRMDILDTKGRPNEPGWSRWSLLRVNATDAPAGIPEPADEFLADLKDALLARKDGGVFSRSTDYSVELVLGEERQP